MTCDKFRIINHYGFLEIVLEHTPYAVDLPWYLVIPVIPVMRDNSGMKFYISLKGETC